MKCCEKNCLADYILEKEPNEDYSKLASFRDFTNNSLVYVDESLFSFFIDMANIFIFNFEKFIKIKKSLVQFFQNLLLKIDLDVGCQRLKQIITTKFATFCFRISSKRRKRPLKDYSSLSLNNCIALKYRIYSFCLLVV